MQSQPLSVRCWCPDQPTTSLSYCVWDETAVRPKGCLDFWRGLRENNDDDGEDNEV